MTLNVYFLSVFFTCLSVVRVFLQQENDSAFIHFSCSVIFCGLPDLLYLILPNSFIVFSFTFSDTLSHCMMSLDFILVASLKKLQNAHTVHEINYKPFIYLISLELMKEQVISDRETTCQSVAEKLLNH